MKKIVAIGGGENGRILPNGDIAPYNTKEIDKEIINLTNKTNPHFLFIGHAMPSINVQESYFQVMKNIYGNKFNCICDDLKSNELTDEIKVKEKIEWADIIYVGGGDTEYMINLWKNSGFDNWLYMAWNKGKVICGISAGAVCWFKSCNSENEESFEEHDFKTVNCLNWINLHVTPHSNEPGRFESTKLQLKENKLIGILLSNCAALEIVDNEFKIVLSDTEAYGIKAYWDNEEYIEYKIKVSESYKNLDELLNK